METQTKLRVPIGDPGRGAHALRAELREAFDRVLASGRYVRGPEHAAFEHELAEYVGVAACAGVASGTDALQLALLAVGCEAGDEVVAVANAGGYTAAAARRLGLRVRYADVDARTLGLSRETVEAVLTRATRAVVVTHLYGLLAGVEEIAALCRERGVTVVEDCAQAAGARRGGRTAGAFGDVAAFSFYPTKNLAALGDGGAVATDSGEVADRVLLLREYGWDAKYRVSVRGGWNSRLDELQAAILRGRLRRLDGWNARGREIVGRYAASLSPLAGRFVAGDGEDYVAHLAVLLTEDRNAARAALEAAGVGTDVHYPIADHRQPAWSGDYPGLSLPVTEHAAEHVLTVPCFAELTDDEVTIVCEALRDL